MFLELLIKIKHIFKPYTQPLLGNPGAIIIDTTTLCNNKCSFCWRSTNSDYLKQICEQFKNTPTMSFKTYKKIIDDCVKHNCVHWLSLCGPMGEPMMNPDLDKFTTYAYKTKHFRTILINTNGLSFDKHSIKKLLNSITHFSISVDSIDLETYSKIHGHKNLAKVIDNIKMLVEYKKKHKVIADIIVRFTENKLNKGQFLEFRKFFENLGVDYINYTKEHSFAGVNESLINYKNMHICNQPNGVINFNVLGEMTTCCINWHLSPTFGNIYSSSIAEMWNGKEKQKWNNKTRFTESPCNKCGGLGEQSQHSCYIKTKKDYQLNSGERQIGENIQSIREDHINRYKLAVETIKHNCNNKKINGLDIFCGNGYGSFLLANELKNADILSIDGSKEAINMAKKFYQKDNINFIQKYFPFELEQNKYDFIVSLESVEHIKDDKLFLKTLSDSLKNNGILVISTPNNEKLCQELNYNPFHYKHYYNNEFISMLKEHNLNLLKIYGQDVYNMNSEGRITSVIEDSSKMKVIENYNGQFTIYIAKKGK